MSILETFYILFESDAENLKKGADEAFKATDNLEKKLKSTDHVADKLGSGFHNMALSAASAIASFVSVGVLVASVMRSVNIADTLKDQSDLLGIGTEQLSAWGDAASIAGGSAEAFQGTISNLSASLAQLDATGKSRVAPFFKELGISLTDGNGKTKETLGLLLEVADKFQDMDKQSIAGFGRKLGLDQGTILLLSQGRRGIEDIIIRQKELGSITEKQALIANTYNDQIEEMSHIVRTLGLAIAEIALPPLTAFFKALADGFIYLRKHENLLQAMGVAFKIAGMAIIAYMLPALASMAMAVLAATWPFLAIAAAVTGFILVLDDFFNFMDGKPSILGDFLKDFPTIEKAFRDIINSVKELWEWLKLLSNPLQAGLVIGSKIGNFLINGKQAIFSAESNPLAAQTSQSLAGQSISNKNTNLSIGEIKIETQATDSEGISKSIGEGLKRQTSQALNNFDNGIAG